MDAWSLSPDNSGMQNGGRAADGFIAHLIGGLGEAGFGKLLISKINELVCIDFFSVYQLNTEASPKMFLSSSTRELDVSADCFKRYQASLHTQDHTFDSAKELTRAGGLCMTYAHQSQFAQAHREAIYSRHGIRERLSIVSEGLGSDLFATNFYRYDNHRPFASNDIDAIESLANSVVACIRKHIAIKAEPARLAPQSPATLVAGLSQVCPRLTPRELDVCAGLLLGRTYDGIAADLNLSLATIKTYRARAYEKLGINFKSQLFAIASQLVGIGPG